MPSYNFKFQPTTYRVRGSSIKRRTSPMPVSARERPAATAASFSFRPYSSTARVMTPDMYQNLAFRKRGSSPRSVGSGGGLKRTYSDSSGSDSTGDSTNGKRRKLDYFVPVTRVLDDGYATEYLSWAEYKHLLEHGRRYTREEYRDGRVVYSPEGVASSEDTSWPHEYPSSGGEDSGSRFEPASSSTGASSSESMYDGLSRSLTPLNMKAETMHGEGRRYRSIEEQREEFAEWATYPYTGPVATMSDMENDSELSGSEDIHAYHSCMEVKQPAYDLIYRYQENEHYPVFVTPGRYKPSFATGAPASHIKLENGPYHSPSSSKDYHKTGGGRDGYFRFTEGNEIKAGNFSSRDNSTHEGFVTPSQWIVDSTTHYSDYSTNTNHEGSEEYFDCQAKLKRREKREEMRAWATYPYTDGPAESEGEYATEVDDSAFPCDSSFSHVGAIYGDAQMLVQNGYETGYEADESDIDDEGSEYDDEIGEEGSEDDDDEDESDGDMDDE